MLYCFLDTNIFLEFRPLKDIPWCKELNAREVCLVVTSVVMRELDKHKSSNSRRKSKRAKAALTLLENVDVGGNRKICQNVWLHFERFEPKLDTFAANNLSTSVPDDILIAMAIEFATANESHTVAIVSGDYGVRLKARGYDLCVPILDDFRLDPEPDPIEKQNQELRNKLFRFQTTQPKLQLGFRDSTGTLVNFLKASNDFSQNLISEAELYHLIEAKRDELQYLSEKQPIDNDLLSVVAASAMFPKVVTSSQIDEYYCKLEEYLEHYRKHLIDISLSNVFPHRSIELTFVLNNEGSSPAQNVDIRLDVQGSTEVLLQVPEVSPYEPSPPAKPEPRSLFDIDHLLARDYSWLGLGANRDDIDLGPPWEEWTQETDRSDLNWYEYGIKKLQHHRSRELEPLYLCLHECDEFPVTVGVKYEVTADNIVDLLSGNLTVIVNKESP